MALLLDFLETNTEAYVVVTVAGGQVIRISRTFFQLAQLAQLAIGIFYYLGAIEVIFFSFRRCLEGEKLSCSLLHLSTMINIVPEHALITMTAKG